MESPITATIAYVRFLIYFYLSDNIPSYTFFLETGSTWESLEWSLMGINIAVSIDSIVLLVLTSVSVCCGRRSNSTARNNQQVAND
jgi:hypothetical protein